MWVKAAPAERTDTRLMEMAGTSHPKVRLKRTVTKKCKAGKGAFKIMRTSPFPLGLTRAVLPEWIKTGFSFRHAECFLDVEVSSLGLSELQVTEIQHTLAQSEFIGLWGRGEGCGGNEELRRELLFGIEPGTRWMLRDRC